MSVALKLKAVKIGVRVTALPAIDPGKGRKELLAPIGASIAQIVSMALVPASEDVLERTIVTLVTPAGEMPVDRAVWHKVKPLRTAHVVIRVAPGTGAEAALLTLATKALATSIGGSLATQLGLGALGQALLTGALAAVGGLLVNLLTAKDEKEEKPVYAITGWRNEVAPNAPVPELFGRQRVAPRHASMPYMDVVGDDIYAVTNLLWGYGPQVIGPLKIGDTPIGKFPDIQVEHRQGYLSDEDLTIYSSQVLEKRDGSELKRGESDSDDDVAVERAIPSDCVGARIIMLWRSGLYHTAEDGGRGTQWTGLRLQHRLIGSETWELVKEFWFDEMKSQPFYRAHTWLFPTRGNYEFRLVRTSKNEDPSRNIDHCQLFAYQGFRPEYVFNFAKPIAVSSIKAKGSDKLNGTIDEINAVNEAIKPDWDGSAWVERVTRRPSSAMVALLRGPSNPRPSRDDQIDWQSFEAWAEFCDEKNLHYDRYHDFEGSFEEAKNAIQAAGRAAVFKQGGKWTVVIDRPSTKIIGHINPRNSQNFKTTATYLTRPPQAVRVEFLDETNDYQAAERLIPWPPAARFATRAEMEANLDFAPGRRVEVYADPVVGNNAYYEKVGKRGTGSWQLASFDFTEKWQLPGKTNPDEIWIECRRLMYEKMYRFASHSATQRGTVRVATKGDHLMASHDVLRTAMYSGRVRQVVGQRIVIDAFFKQEEGVPHAIRFRHHADNDDVIGESILRPVQAFTGESKAVTLMGTGPVPAPGDLVQFGPSARDGRQVILVGAQPGNGNSAVLHMVPAAPEIDRRTDEEVPPPWSGRVGGPVSIVNTPPGTPIVTAVRSGYSGTRNPNGLRIWLTGAPGGLVTVDDFQIRHRKVGETVWQGPASAAAASGSVEVTGYLAGDAIELQPRAVSIYAIPSEWGATVTHTIGQDDAGQTLAVSASTVGTFNLGGVLFSLEGDPEDNNLRKVACHRRPAGAVWDPASVPFKVVELVGGAAKKVRDGAKRVSLYADPDFNTPGLHSVTGNFAVANGQATKTATTASSRLYQTLGAAPATGSAIRMAAIVSATNDTDSFGFFLRNDVATAADAGTMSPSTGTGLRRGRINVTAARTLLGVTTSATRTITIEAMAGFVEQAGDLAAGDYIYRFVSLNEDDRAGAYSEITVSIV